MKKQPNQRPFDSLLNDVWFHGHPTHRNGQNGRLKKIDTKKSFNHFWNGYYSWTVGAIKVKKFPNESSFNSLSIDVWFHGHLIHRNGRNDLLKKNRPSQKSSGDLLWILQLADVLGVCFIRKAVSTISETRMTMKLYIIRKGIEWAFIW